MIPYGKQWITNEDINAVTEVLKSDWLTTGPMIDRFENKLAETVGTKYAVAFSSGTAALHAAYYTAGITAGDEIITSPITFAATANAARFLCAYPVFVDINPNTYCINEALIENEITEHTKAIIPVHMAGKLCNMHEIKRIADKHNLTLIEDACHALGTIYKSKADMSVFSFHPVKHITTGEGGAVTTNNKTYYDKLKAFRTHGIIGGDMQFLGYNYRITDFQCALGLSQLKKLSSFWRRRMQIAVWYDKYLCGKVITPLLSKSALHLYVIRMKNRDKAKEELYNRGIITQIHYRPVYMHSYYQELIKKTGIYKPNCPNAEQYYQEALSLPLYPAMTDEQVEYVIKNILEVLEECM